MIKNRNPYRIWPATNFSKLSNLVMTDYAFLTMSISAKWFYVVLVYLNNKSADYNGYFRRSDRALENDTGLSRPTIQRARVELLAKGYIEIKSGKVSRVSNEYKIALIP